LKLPTDEASRGRATLFDTLTPDHLHKRKTLPDKPAATNAPLNEPLPSPPTTPPAAQ